MKVIYISEKDNISRLPENKDISILWFGNAAKAFEKATEDSFDAAVIAEDVVMSHSLCRYFSENLNMPVLFICKDNSEKSVISAFKSGAADCMYGKNRLVEISARLYRLLNRKAKTKPLTFEDIVIYTDKGRVTKGGREVYLSQLEYRILLVMFTQAGQIVTRESIADMIWESQASFVTDNTVTVYINRIRKKLENDPRRPAILKTVRGVGYLPPGGRLIYKQKHRRVKSAV